MDEPKPERSEDVQRVLEIYNLKEYVVDRELEKLESRLEARIKEVKDDLNDRITRLETRLQWSMGIAVATAAIIIPLIVKFLSS